MRLLYTFSILLPHTSLATVDRPEPDIASTLDNLAAAIRQEHERAAFRESVIDRLHEENQRLRRGELEALLSPVRNGLFRLHDMARKAAAQVRSNPDSSPSSSPGSTADLLDAVADEAVDILTGVGVERFETVVGEVYDPVRHRPVAAAAAANAVEDNTIAEVRAAGFATADRVIRRADVVVARFEGDGRQ